MDLNVFLERQFRSKRLKTKSVGYRYTYQIYQILNNTSSQQRLQLSDLK